MLFIFSIFATGMCLCTLLRLFWFMFPNDQHGLAERELSFVNILIDFLLLIQFACSHTFLTSKNLSSILQLKNHRVQSVQRSTYVLATAVSLEVLMFWWKKLPFIITIYTPPIWLTILQLVYIIACGLTIIQSLYYDPMEFVGLAQAVANPYKIPSEIKTLYQHMRHPIFVFFMFVVWTPFLSSISLDSLLIATFLTWYLLAKNEITNRDVANYYNTEYSY
eukprot:TRINITY_DN9725_c0_g1_i1.p1 TRINITY_DN9725_c0_g1~~TRINITY_DN9725_c0_g1_i1.p1  ORF type:complete len:221 (+),score=3.25 TRINITY_DN9725_c0_g1_i1:103-765(+)